MNQALGSWNTMNGGIDADDDLQLRWQVAVLAGLSLSVRFAAALARYRDTGLGQGGGAGRRPGSQRWMTCAWLAIGTWGPREVQARSIAVRRCQP